MNELTHLDLFSGIGGFALAARWAGFRTIGFCEIDPYCRKVLAKNFLPQSDAIGCNGWAHDEGQAAPERARPEIIGDIRTLDGRQFAGVDLVTGGFPCQPFSCAGKRRGAADDRSLWPEMRRIADEVAQENRKLGKDTWLLGENVAGIISMELDSVLSDLEAIGYACRPFVIPACGVDARHRRNRVWIVAHCLRERRQQIAGSAYGDEAPNEGWPPQHDHKSASGGEDVAYSDEPRSQGRNGGSVRECATERTSRASDSPISDATIAGLEGAKRTQLQERGSGSTDDCRWLPEPDVGRVAHGIPNRVDRLKGLGNAIVPQVAFQILKAIALTLKP